MVGITAEKLTNLILRCLNDIIKAIPDESDMIVLQVLIESAPPLEVANSFMEYAYPLRDKIKRRDESFFLSNDVFGPVSKNQIDHFRKLWKSGCLDDSKPQIWKWFDILIVACDKYSENSKKTRCSEHNSEGTCVPTC
jgi:hypothetical protein